MDTQLGEGGGVSREIGVDMYTVLCIKSITNENLPCHSGNSPHALC